MECRERRGGGRVVVSGNKAGGLRSVECHGMRGSEVSVMARGEVR